MKHTEVTMFMRVFFGVLALAAVVTEVVVLIDRGMFNFGNFFSFFTILSNIFAAVVLLIAAYSQYTEKRVPYLNMLRGAATYCMVFTGIIFAALLSNLDPRLLTAVPWDNVVLHYLMPVVLLIDWLMHPPERRITFKTGLLWLAIPTGYLLYTLLRGPLVGWYPYPFLNPDLSGYGKLLIVVVAILLFGIGLVYVLTWVTGRAKRA